MPPMRMAGIAAAKRKNKKKKDPDDLPDGDELAESSAAGAPAAEAPEAPADALPDSAAEEENVRKPNRFVEKVLGFLNSLALQTCLYLAFVVVFQSLAATMRLKEEYYMDKVGMLAQSKRVTLAELRRCGPVGSWLLARVS